MPYRLLGVPLALGVVVFAIFYVLSLNGTTPAIESVPVTNPEIEVSVPVQPKLTVEEKVGRLFMAGHWANTPTASTTALVEKYHLGGVVIMSSPPDPADISQWTGQWQAVTDYPLVIAIDQEGGVVSRLKGDDFIQTSQPEITTPEEAYAVAKQRGTELSDLGINTNFAPVIESSVNPNGFLFKRVFRDPEFIFLLGKSTLSGYQDAGITGVIKHYPGHEDEPTDSHEALPVVELSNTSFVRHTENFNELIALSKDLSNNLVGAIMTSHVLVPSIDPDFPATLSKKILTGELREKQQFDGIVITDDMTMDAIDTLYTTAEASKLALLAGADLILFAADPASIGNVIPFIIEAVTSGEIPESLIDEHFDRVSKWQASY